VFSHTGEAGSSATQRIDSEFDLSGSWRTAENIAIQSIRGEPGLMDDVEDLHTSLMNSPGHRANLLNPDLDYIGLGIELDDFTYSSGGTFESLIVTQNFATTAGMVDLDSGSSSTPVDTPDGPVAEDPTDNMDEPPADDMPTDMPADEPDEEPPVADMPDDEPDQEPPVMDVPEDDGEDDPVVAETPDDDSEDDVPVTDEPDEEEDQPDDGDSDDEGDIPIAEAPDADQDGPMDEEPPEETPDEDTVDTPVAEAPDSDPEDAPVEDMAACWSFDDIFDFFPSLARFNSEDADIFVFVFDASTACAPTSRAPEQKEPVIEMTDDTTDTDTMSVSCFDWFA
jgi:hypothetical protein